MTAFTATDFDSFTGAYETNNFDLDNGKIIIAKTQDITKHIEKNKALINSGQNGFTASRDGRIIADIPMIMVEWLKNEKGIDILGGDQDHLKAAKKWLRNPENKFLTTVHGQF